MEHDTTRKEPLRSEQAGHPAYEPPRIEDYGTLVDLTAGKGDADPDFFGQWESKDGGGYS